MMVGFDDRPLWRLASRRGFRRAVRRAFAIIDVSARVLAGRLPSLEEVPCGQRFGTLEKRGSAQIGADANGERGATARGSERYG